MLDGLKVYSSRLFLTFIKFSWHKNRNDDERKEIGNTKNKNKNISV